MAKKVKQAKLEVKTTRTLEDIDKQCKELLNTAGIKQYQVAVLKAELLDINQKVQNLSTEALQLQASAAEKAKETPKA